jgi:predicted MPP superfamily phosphohydrolase
MPRKHHHPLVKFIFVVISLLAIIVLSLVYIDSKNVVYETFIFDEVGEHDLTIVQLSDLHLPHLEVNLDQMLTKLKEEKPDLIMLTGDLIDSRSTYDEKIVTTFLSKVTTLSPVFFVSGNHEIRQHENYSRLKETLEKYYVITFDDEMSHNLEIRGTNLTIIGLQNEIPYHEAYLEKNPEASNNYRILLAHQPQQFIDSPIKTFSSLPQLILSGHTHGGQIRIFNQGLFSFDQGFFPKYDAGLYEVADGDAKMVISRGLGNSLLPFRFNNKPHVPIIKII